MPSARYVAAYTGYALSLAAIAYYIISEVKEPYMASLS